MQPTTIKFGAGTVYIGDGDSPEVFTKICGFTSINLDFGKDTNTSQIPDCDDPDAATFDGRDVTSMSFSASCEGVLAVEALDLVEDAYFSTESQNVRIELAGAGTGGGTPNRRYAGKMHVKHKLGGSRGERWGITLDFENDGVITKSNVAAA